MGVKSFPADKVFTLDLVLQHEDPPRPLGRRKVLWFSQSPKYIMGVKSFPADKVFTLDFVLQLEDAPRPLGRRKVPSYSQSPK